MISEKTKRAVHSRSGDLCERCGGGGPFELHHRNGQRGQSHDTAKNLELLCKPCHRRHHTETRRVFGGNDPRRPTVLVTFRLTPKALELLESLAKRQGLGQAAVLEMLIRREARKDETP